MKREYVKPMMYQEDFVPNAYASGCAPGIDESTAQPYAETCWYLTHGNSCSRYNTDLLFFIEGNQSCKDVWLKEDGSAGTRGGIYIGYEDFEGDGKDYAVPAYIWSNGTFFGAHYIPVTELGGTVGGKPRYFNS